MPLQNEARINSFLTHSRANDQAKTLQTMSHMVPGLFCHQEKQHSNEDVNYEASVKQHYEKLVAGTPCDTDVAKQFRDKNWVRFRGSPEWCVDISADYMQKKDAVNEGGKVSVFSGADDHDKIVHDPCRKMYDCRRDSVMFHLITAPVTLALAKHGLLVMPDGKSREPRIAACIESEGGPPPAEQRRQGWHGDFAAFLAAFFGLEFGFSVLVGCTDGGGVDVLSKTYGNEDDEYLKAVDADDSRAETVYLAKGEAIALGPGLRHRGRGYLLANMRHFIAYLGGKSVGASFSFTYSVQKLRHMIARGVGGLASGLGGRTGK